MYKFGPTSQERLKTCHQDLQLILNTVIKIYDFSVLEGIRSDNRQLKLFNEGKSTLDGIEHKSKHQANKDNVSMAVDIMPYYKGFNPFQSENGPKSFYFLAGIMIATAHQLFNEGKITHLLRWGGNWDSDMDFFSDSNFFDLPHFELVKGL